MSAKSLSIIIPVYNEEQTIAALLDRVVAAPLPGMEREIVVVNDGSRDRSPALIREWAAAHAQDAGCRVVVLDKPNGGKGSAVRAGIVASTGDVVIIQDADLEYDPNDYAACVAPILAGSAKVVYGSRERFARNRSHSSWAFYLGGLSVTYWMNLLYGSGMTDEPTCYKTFDGPLVRSLLFEQNGFDWEPELTAKLLRLGYEIFETPISYQPRRTAEGKKICWRDGVRALWVALVWRVRPLGKERAKLAALPDEQPRQDRLRRERHWLWGIVALALTVRVLLALPGLLDGVERFTRPDTASYLGPATALVADGAYREAPGSAVAATLRPPGFPLFAAAVYAVTGESWRLLVLALCAVGALTCIPVFKAGYYLGGLGAAAVAGLLFALNITAISASPLLLSDTLYGLLAAAVCAWMLRWWRRHRLIDAWLAVIAAALSALVRPVGLLWLAPVIVLLLLFPPWRWRKRLLAVVGAVAIYALLLLPWMARNYHVGAGWSLDTNTGYTLLYHNVPALLAEVTGKSAETYRQLFVAKAEATFAADPVTYASPAARQRYLTSRAMTYIGEHPWRYARLHLEPRTLLPDAPAFYELLGVTRTGQGTLDVLRREGLFAAVDHYFGGRTWLLLPLLPLLVLVGLAYLGCAVQLAIWLWHRQWFLGLLFMALAAYYVVLPGPIAMPRYHLPALPMIAAMAGLALAAWWQRRQARRNAATQLDEANAKLPDRGLCPRTPAGETSVPPDPRKFWWGLGTATRPQRGNGDRAPAERILTRFCP